MTFHVGQKVVCIDSRNINYGSWCPGPGMTLDGLTKGTVYTVRRVGEFLGLPCIWLHEIVRPPFQRTEAGYSIHRFRPVKTTSIEIFRQMLNPVREDA